ncbi:MAG: GNAT family N-acetyltransferase [Gammaproteobacteria bacterium]|nr:GNAT family N-acetyltransferase [Gammaproteobacteria bacterium]
MDKNTGIAVDLEAYRRTLAETGYRGMVVITGQQAWCYAQAREVMDSDCSSLWIGTEGASRGQTIPASACIHQLGCEHADVVFDAWSGFDPDALGVISGTLRSGAILFLLTPDFDNWELYDDPEYTRIKVEPYTNRDVGRRFIKHVMRVLNDSNEIIIWRENGKTKIGQLSRKSKPNKSDIPAPYRTKDQKSAVDAIDRLVGGHRRRPLLIVSDRGRGKSSALGIAAAKHMLKSGDKVGVCAPGRRQVDEIFSRVMELHPEAIQHANKLCLNESDIEFYPPDVLLRDLPKLNILFIDEAAAIPLPMLEDMLLNYSRVVYSTTVHGYEGTGKGFENKFASILNQRCDKWYRLRLYSPIRWSEGDVLEKITNRLLLMDADNNNYDLEYAESEISVEMVKRDDFIYEENDLIDWFGLLVSAHYKTRPYDLRQILDGPNIKIWNVKLGGKIIATAVVAKEGLDLDSELAEGIYQGRRRLHGHLMPQTLLVHAGNKDALRYKYLRVVRIAVLDEYRNKGVARLLINEIEQWAVENEIDYMATSYGADKELLSFWRHVGFSVVRIGLKKEASTGQYNFMMLKSLCSLTHIHKQQLQLKLYKDIPYLLAEPLRNIDAAYIVDLAESINTGKIDNDILTSVHEFCSGNRLYETVIRELSIILGYFLTADSETRNEEQRYALILLVERVWQKREPEYFASKYGLDSKAKRLSEIKMCTKIVLNTISSAC